MLDILIKNAKIIDGTGLPVVEGNVGIRGDKIVYPTEEQAAKKVIDAAGRMVSPGFIDAHSHGDLILGTESAHLFKTNQGVTTEVTGQCGLSIAPTNPAYLDLVQHLLSLGTASFPDDMVNWNNFSRYLEYADKQPKTANVMMYVGHSTLRIAVMGFANRVATDEELEQMKAILKDAMEHGAAGFSTGLIYTPSCYADEREVVELAKVIKPYHGIYASHMRNESYDIIKSVRETIDVGRKAGVTVDISHHKTLGKANWGLQKETLRLIQEARDEGINVVCDQYPYTCNMTHLNACIPPWYFDQGFDIMTEQLKDPEFRAKLRKEMEDPETPYDNYYLNAGGWSGVFVSSSTQTPQAEGKFISEYAAEIGKDPWDAFFELMVENKCSSGGVYSSMCEADVCEIASAPFCIVGSDGLTRSWEEKGHPRASATFPHAITYFVKEKKLFTLEHMIRKMTGLTADSLSIKRKGYIRDGYDADLVIFDYDRLKDTATYTNSNSLTEGIDYVLVNGQIVYEDMKLTGIYSGKMIRHNA
ncbi:N-acyl-D-amino-acid deacylase family protein [Enterocloster lavalensis]|uniref:N-acyl-D-amino-acid deacylase family protein n=3 Tax=Enterocloster TaxID=2719313 RepID=UPI0023F05036|nr:D-aminoacylase [Enterocloster lavalensis]